MRGSVLQIIFGESAECIIPECLYQITLKKQVFNGFYLFYTFFQGPEKQRCIKQFLKNLLEHFLSVKFTFSIIRSDILVVIVEYFICSLTKFIICNGIYLIILSYILGEQLT